MRASWNEHCLKYHPDAPFPGSTTTAPAPKKAEAGAHRSELLRRSSAPRVVRQESISPLGRSKLAPAVEEHEEDQESTASAIDRVILKQTFSRRRSMDDVVAPPRPLVRRGSVPIEAESPERLRAIAASFASAPEFHSIEDLEVSEQMMMFKPGRKMSEVCIQINGKKKTLSYSKSLGVLASKWKGSVLEIKEIPFSSITSCEIGASDLMVILSLEDGVKNFVANDAAQAKRFIAKIKAFQNYLVAAKEENTGDFESHVKGLMESSSLCELCDIKFSVSEIPFVCRSCKKVVCRECSGQKALIGAAKLEEAKMSRVCLSCSQKFYQFGI